MKPDSSRSSTSAPRFGKAMIAAAWILLLGLLTVVFNQWLENQHNPNKSVDSQTTDTYRQVILLQNRQGHYVATGAINGEAVEYLLDTGATSVSVPAHIATRLNLPSGPEIPVTTANGTVMVHATRLEHVELGNISLYNISATINPYVRDNAVLLGMSFLRKLEFTQRGDTLTIRQYHQEPVRDARQTD